jgi:hypothetical protein
LRIHDFKNSDLFPAFITPDIAVSCASSALVKLNAVSDAAEQYEILDLKRVNQMR